MNMTHHDLVAAVFNTSSDIVELLRRAFEPAGIVVVTALTPQIRSGAIDVEAFVRQHDPDVVVYDIAPPYDENWRLFQHVRQLRSLRDRPIVLTSINPRHVTALAGADTTLYEIVGKPYDLEQLVRAVKEAAYSRPTR